VSTQRTTALSAADQFNAIPDGDARERLASCLAVPRWIEEMLAGRPYAGLDELLARGRQAAARLTRAEVEAALVRHPRIGERAGAAHNAEFSTREQAGVTADERQAEALRRGNAAYEARFARVFLIRAAGRSGPEILAELERRLLNSDEAELAEVVTQLGEIAVLRLEQLAQL